MKGPGYVVLGALTLGAAGLVGWGLSQDVTATATATLALFAAVQIGLAMRERAEQREAASLRYQGLTGVVTATLAAFSGRPWKGKPLSCVGSRSELDAAINDLERLFDPGAGINRREIATVAAALVALREARRVQSQNLEWRENPHHARPFVPEAKAALEQAKKTLGDD